MGIFSSFVRVCIDLAGDIDHNRRRYLYDENQFDALNEDAKWQARRGWIEQNADGTFTAFGTSEDAWGNPQRFSFRAANEEATLAQWRQAYGSLEDPLAFDRPDGVTFAAGSRWWDASGAHHGLWDDHEPWGGSGAEHDPWEWGWL